MGSKGSALSGVQGQSPWPFFLDSLGSCGPQPACLLPATHSLSYLLLAKVESLLHSSRIRPCARIVTHGTAIYPCRTKTAKERPPWGRDDIRHLQLDPKSNL